jgi:uncharacterized membrane protein
VPCANWGQMCVRASSPTWLSVSTIFVIFGVVFVVVAGIFDNWTEYEVDRREISSALNRQSDLMARLKDRYTKDKLYFPRTYGLFHICFPEGVPSGIGSFAKVTQTCVLNEDYFPDDITRSRYNEAQTLRMWIMRLNIISYVVGVIILFVALIVSVFGCYKQSTRATMSTALLLIVSVLILLCSMACFHYVSYLENTLTTAPFYKTWEPVLRQATRQNYGWTYVLAWVGIGCVAFSAVFFVASYMALKRERLNELESKHQAYYNNYEKSMLPYQTAPYGTYNMYPAPYYGQYPMANSYYGYMTYGH